MDSEWKKLNISKDMNEVMMEQDSDAHHQISKSRNEPLNIYSYVYANRGDPAFVVHCAFKYGLLRVELICLH
jgi:hypothetical protein